jgi:hypothetical protein
MAVWASKGRVPDSVAREKLAGLFYQESNKIGECRLS